MLIAFCSLGQLILHLIWLINLLQEPDIFGVDDDKRASLLRMNFSVKEVDFAMEKLGM